MDPSTNNPFQNDAPASSPVLPEIQSKAKEVDDKYEEVFRAAAPVVTAPAEAVNQVIDALNELMPLFGQPALPPQEQDLDQEPMPTRIMKALTMVDMAEQNFGIDTMSLPNKGMDAQDLTMLAGQIRTLAKDETFTRGLKSKAPDENQKPTGILEKATPDAQENSSPTSGPDMMGLFANRMGGGQVTPKTLDITDTTAARRAVSDVVVWGNPDVWQLVCKASSVEQGWMKSTKAMDTGDGCWVQITTQQRNPDGSYVIAETLSFAIGHKVVVTGRDENGVVTSRAVRPIDYT